jgi:hypothetical protein
VYRGFGCDEAISLELWTLSMFVGCLLRRLRLRRSNRSKSRRSVKPATLEPTPMPICAAVERPLLCCVWGKLRAKTSFSITLTDTVELEDEAVAAISDSS